MARSKAPSARGSHANGFYHREQTRRWATRKRNQLSTDICNIVDDVEAVGGTRQMFWRRQNLAWMKAQAAKKEREMLATTSLGNLIK